MGVYYMVSFISIVAHLQLDTTWLGLLNNYSFVDFLIKLFRVFLKKKKNFNERSDFFSPDEKG